MGAPYRVLGVRHGVEGTNSRGKLVKDVEVNAILLLDQLAQVLLLRRAVGRDEQSRHGKRAHDDLT